MNTQDAENLREFAKAIDASELNGGMEELVNEMIDSGDDDYCCEIYMKNGIIQTEGNDNYEWPGFPVCTGTSSTNGCCRKEYPVERAVRKLLRQRSDRGFLRPAEKLTALSAKV